MQTVNCSKHGVVSGNNIRTCKRRSGKIFHKCRICEREREKRLGSKYRTQLKHKYLDAVTAEFLEKTNINPEWLSDRVIAGKHAQLKAMKQGLIITTTTGAKK